MGACDDAGTFTVDFTRLQSIGAVALNRWANKNHLSARLRIADLYGLKPSTVDDWVQGRRPIPQTRLAQLVRDLDEGFALELVRELIRQGELRMFVLIFRQHISRLLEDTDAPRTRNRNGRCAHVGNNCNSDLGLDSSGRAFEG